MSLETIISYGLTRPDENLTALVLMGGGARTAYQAGVLQAVARIVAPPNETGKEPHFPFKILVGTSAGALNACYLASRASEGPAAFEQLASFWATLRSAQVYQLKVPGWIRSSRIAAALFLSQQVRKQQAFLNNTPLVDTLHRAISLTRIDEALQNKTLLALAVTASSYTSGVHWTFCQTASAGSGLWQRPGRRAEFQPITIEHLMASSAIPFLFPATPLWVDGRREFFGDGSMRQSSPLSSALHLGASKILVIGVGQPERAGFAGNSNPGIAARPSLGAIAGHALASVFQDTLQADVEQAQRVSKTLRQMPREIAAVMPYRPIEVLAISPSQSLDALAQAHAGELPAATYNALAGLGALGARGSPSGAALASYLLFEPGFVKALMALGERDAYARKDELLAFFGPP
ncbi:patatin-like phospholipase family protein [Polaromonas sp.]|uniref:patatin-like phospholipase family protein n=1 Tax=Polaromonas sp. TaxID=1869339 RepID=UPI00375295D2